MTDEKDIIRIQVGFAVVAIVPPLNETADRRYQCSKGTLSVLVCWHDSDGGGIHRQYVTWNRYGDCVRDVVDTNQRDCASSEEES